MLPRFQRHCFFFLALFLIAACGGGSDSTPSAQGPTQDNSNNSNAGGNADSEDATGSDGNSDDDSGADSSADNNGDSDADQGDSDAESDTDNGNSEDDEDSGSDDAEGPVECVRTLRGQELVAGGVLSAVAEDQNRTTTAGLCLEALPPGSVVAPAEITTAVSVGILDFAVVRAVDLVGINGGYEVFGLPFLFDSRLTAEAFQGSDAGQKLLESLADNSLIAPGFINKGFAHFAGNADIVEPADLNARKIRRRTSTEIDNALYETLGISAIGLAFAEIGTALFTGVIDGVEGDVAFFTTLLQDDLASQSLTGITITNHSLDARVLIVNATVWDSLALQTQENLTDTAGRVSDDIAAGNDAAIEQIAADGTALRLLSEAERDVWVEAVEPVLLQFQDRIGTELVEAAQSTGKVQTP